MDGILAQRGIRPMQASDFDECIRVAQEKYRTQLPRLHYDATVEFLEMARESSIHLLLRGDDLFWCAGVQRTFMEPLPVCGVLWIFTKRPNLRELDRAMDVTEKWAADMGCCEIGFGNIGNRTFDGLAKWWGYRESSRYYSKTLKGGG